MADEIEEAGIKELMNSQMDDLADLPGRSEDHKIEEKYQKFKETVEEVHKLYDNIAHHYSGRKDQLLIRRKGRSNKGMKAIRDSLIADNILHKMKKNYTSTTLTEVSRAAGQVPSYVAELEDRTLSETLEEYRENEVITLNNGELGHTTFSEIANNYIGHSGDAYEGLENIEGIEE